jgi:hypothetical protein
VFLPVGVCIIAMLIEKPATKYASDFGLIGLAIYGTANSLLTITFVSPYRKYTFEKLVSPWLMPLLTRLHLKNHLHRIGDFTSQHSVSNVHEPRRSASVHVVPSNFLV